MRTLAGDIKARLLQAPDHRWAVGNFSRLDPPNQIVGDPLPGVLRSGFQDAAMRRLKKPRPRRIVWPAPAVLVVEVVAQRRVRPLPIRRRDVEAAPAGQVAAGGYHVDVDAAARIAVLYRRPGVAVRIQAGPGELFKLVQGAADLPISGPVLRGPRNHPRRVAVFELQRVGNIGDLLGIAAQHLNVLPRLPLPVKRLREVVGHRRSGSGPMLQEPNQHRCLRGS